MGAQGHRNTGRGEGMSHEDTWGKSLAKGRARAKIAWIEEGRGKMGK